MTKRLTAAFVALLVSLAGLPLIAADPVSAHTQTVRRCAYDPFAGQQCWNEAVAHVHPPNNYSPPPDTRTRADQEAERKRQEAKRKADEAERTRIAEEAARQQAERERLAEQLRKAQEAEAKRKAAEADTSDGDDTSGNDDTSGDDDTSDNDDTPEDTTPDNDDTPEDSSTTPDNDDTPEDSSTTPDNDDTSDKGARGTRSGRDGGSGSGSGSDDTSGNTDPCQAWTEATRDAIHNSRAVTPAPDGCGSDLGKVWAAIKKAVNKVHAANGEAALSNAEIRAQFGKDVVAAFKKAMRETDYTSMGGGIPVAGTPIEAEAMREVAAAAGTQFLAQWDKMSPTEKVLMQAALCGLVAATTFGVAGAACGIAVGLADIHIPRPEQSAAPAGDSTPREGGTAAARPQPDSDTSGDSDDNNQGDAAPETKIGQPELQQANRDHNAGRISLDQLRSIQNRYRCQIGYQQYC